MYTIKYRDEAVEQWAIEIRRYFDKGYNGRLTLSDGKSFDFRPVKVDDVDVGEMGTWGWVTGLVVPANQADGIDLWMGDDRSREALAARRSYPIGYVDPLRVGEIPYVVGFEVF